MNIFTRLLNSVPLFGRKRGSHKPVQDAGLLVPVPKWTHPGKKGKSICCPNCMATVHVFHFGWESLKCNSCKQFIDKYDWLINVKRMK
tara:strand:+ start:129 stop:392 length:264 start_codon:yes stop_codon:yes gene_type:complete